MVISREIIFFLISFLPACWVVRVEGFCFVPADTALRSVSVKWMNDNLNTTCQRLRLVTNKSSMSNSMELITFYPTSVVRTFLVRMVTRAFCRTCRNVYDERGIQKYKLRSLLVWSMQYEMVLQEKRHCLLYYFWNCVFVWRLAFFIFVPSWSQIMKYSIKHFVQV